MSDVYFGRPGAQEVIPHPRGGVQSDRDRPTAVFRTGGGGARTSRTFSGKRQYTLNWERLWYETYAQLEAYHHGHNGPGPLVLHDPARTNWLTVNQSGATSHLNDTDGFSLAATGSNISSSSSAFHRGPRSLRWRPDADGGLNIATSAAYALTPNADAIEVTGDLDIRVRVQMTDWTPLLSFEYVSRSATEFCYELGMSGGGDSGKLYLFWSVDGTGATDQTVLTPAVVAVTLGLANNDILSLRATLEVATGQVRFYYSEDEDLTDAAWSALGTLPAAVGATSVFAGTNPMAVGSEADGVSTSDPGAPIVIYSAQVRDGVNGTLVADPRFDEQPAGIGQFTDSVGRVWTLFGGASINHSPAPTGALLTADSPTLTWPGIPVIAGQPMAFSCYTLAGLASTAVTLTPRIAWFDEEGALLSASTGTPVAQNTSWQLLTASGTPPAGAVYMLCQVAMSGGVPNEEVYLDEFQLQRGASATAWRPGTGVYPVTVVSLTEQWPWQAEDYREQVSLVLQEAGP